MGEIYRAEDLRLGRHVAIKVLSFEKTDEQESAGEGLIREGRCASVLNHPNIVTIYTIEHLGADNFIVMEFIEGQSLSAILQHGRLELPSVLQIGAQVADALAAAHSIG